MSPRGRETERGRVKKVFDVENGKIGGAGGDGLKESTGVGDCGLINLSKVSGPGRRTH